METLELNEDLFNSVIIWMRPKYALSTIRERGIFLRSLFKKHKVLNVNSLKKMMRQIKHQHQRASINMLNNYCYDNDIDFSIRVPSIKAQAKKLPEILSAAEIKLMVESSPKPYDLALRCIFNMGAGLRVSEIIKFSWNHIRWVDWIGNKNSFGVAMIKSGKGMKDRMVNIPKKLMKDLYEYAKEQKNLNEFGIPQGGMIFPFWENEGIKTEKARDEVRGFDLDRYKDLYVRSRYDWFRYNIIQKYCEKALNKKLKVHQLRHSRATYLYEIEKVPIEKIQVLLGHSSMNTTMIYTRVNPQGIFDMLKETKEI
jgi:integrase